MKKIEKKAAEYRLPMTSTLEKLETRFLTDAVFLTFGNRVLMAGYFYQGRNKNAYYGATFEFTTDDRTCEGEIKLTGISEDFFADNGSAMQWAMTH